MRVLDVCAGVGGFSLAAEWLGWTVVGQVEIDPWCRSVLAKHWPDVPRMNDIREVRGDEFGPIDVLAGGIPCQPFSVAGKQRGKHDDRHLWPEFARIAQAARPRYLVVENVAGFVRMALDDVLSNMEAIGYSGRAAVVPACAVGALHRRDRVWIVARRGDAEPLLRDDG